MTGQSTVPAHIGLFTQAEWYQDIAHLTGTSKFDVPRNENVIHEYVKLGSFLLESASPCSLDRYEVVVVSPFLQCLQNKTALFRHKCLVRGRREAGDIGDITHTAGVICCREVKEGG